MSAKLRIQRAKRVAGNVVYFVSVGSSTTTNETKQTTSLLLQIYYKVWNMKIRYMIYTVFQS